MWLQVAALLCPRGKSAAARSDVALPHNTSPQVLTSSWYLLLSGLAAVASLAAVHTQRVLSTFFASPLFLSHPKLGYTPQLQCEILKCCFKPAAVFFF